MNQHPESSCLGLPQSLGIDLLHDAAVSTSADPTAQSVPPLPVCSASQQCVLKASVGPLALPSVENHGIGKFTSSAVGTRLSKSHMTDYYRLEKKEKKINDFPIAFKGIGCQF